jgi:hypothetical protein
VAFLFVVAGETVVEGLTQCPWLQQYPMVTSSAGVGACKG